jgi:hypothetical protein
MFCVIMHVATGQAVEGVLLKADRDRMRVAIPGSDETWELRRADGVWCMEDGSLVEFDAVLSDGDSGGEELAGVYPRVQAAGRR